MRAPDLAASGLRLLGARSLPAADGGTAVQLAYEDAFGARFTLYLVRPGGLEPDDFRFSTNDGTGSFAWSYQELHCVLIGDAHPARLLEIARSADAQLDADETSGS